MYVEPWETEHLYKPNTCVNRTNSRPKGVPFRQVYNALPLWKTDMTWLFEHIRLKQDWYSVLQSIKICFTILLNIWMIHSILVSLYTFTYCRLQRTLFSTAGFAILRFLIDTQIQQDVLWLRRRMCSCSVQCFHFECTSRQWWRRLLTI